MSSEDKLKQGSDLAMASFNTLLQECGDNDEILGFVQMMSTLSIKVIHGIAGREFKKGFLESAINDNQMIRPVRVSKAGSKQTH